jgi:transcriptional regulator with XRE-family HTH domain
MLPTLTSDRPVVPVTKPTTLRREEATAAYAALDSQTQSKLLDWIAAVIAPATRVYPLTSYAIKHYAEEAIGVYIRNDEFKGAMLACGYEPTTDSGSDVNWRFRIKPRLLRAAPGQRGLGGLRVSFGAMLRYRREAAGIGMRELARKVGISASYLSKIEHDEFRPPAEDVVVAIARELQIDPDILLAHAGRVATDVLELIKQQPVAMAKLVREAKNAK